MFSLIVQNQKAFIQKIPIDSQKCLEITYALRRFEKTRRRKLGPRWFRDLACNPLKVKPLVRLARVQHRKKLQENPWIFLIISGKNPCFLFFFPGVFFFPEEKPDAAAEVFVVHLYEAIRADGKGVLESQRRFVEMLFLVFVLVFFFFCFFWCVFFLVFFWCLFSVEVLKAARSGTWRV